MIIDASEIWKPVVGWGAYEVSDYGRVLRIATGRILKPWIDADGRPHVNLHLHEKKSNSLVSHLVADAFLPPKKPTDQVLRHLNDDPADNRIENLAYGTYSDNKQDSVRNETFARGITHGMAKLTEDNVREIRRLYATGNFTQRELARQFGVGVPTICMIVLRQTWKHVA